MTRIGFVKRAILAPQPSLLIAALYILLAIAIPTLFRLAIDPLIQGRLPYVTYFPAVMLIAILMDWRAATAVAAGSAVMANALFSVGRAPAWDVSEIMVGVLLFALAAALLIFTGQTLRRTVRELEATAKREAFLAAELGHRAKNHLALIEALARQTQQSGQSPEAFFNALIPRIQTLARAQELLTRSGWTACELHLLVADALRPFAHHPGIRVEGPQVRISPAGCTALIMALHELGTNALKYGALSLPGGSVTLRWTVQAEEGLCLLEWAEHNGPLVNPPLRRGLGSRLIARHPSFERAEIKFDAEGVRCTIAIALTQMAEAA